MSKELSEESSGGFPSIYEQEAGFLARDFGRISEDFDPQTDNPETWPEYEYMLGNCCDRILRDIDQRFRYLAEFLWDKIELDCATPDVVEDAFNSNLSELERYLDVQFDWAKSKLPPLGSPNEASSKTTSKSASQKLPSGYGSSSATPSRKQNSSQSRTMPSSGYPSASQTNPGSATTYLKPSSASASRSMGSRSRTQSSRSVSAKTSQNPSGNGTGSGYQSGYGSGSAQQCGTGYGSGTGQPSGTGYGSGSKSRTQTGSGYPSGSGYQTGSGYQSGSGYPSGYGSGVEDQEEIEGEESGTGYGEGSGYPSEQRSGSQEQSGSGGPSKYGSGSGRKTGSGYGSGYQSGYPSGSGSNTGYNSGSGSGYPSGTNSDQGSGYPSAKGSGYQSEEASGYPYGSGSGPGSGYPSRVVSGSDQYGTGDGSGYQYGTGQGSQQVIQPSGMGSFDGSRGRRGYGPGSGYQAGYGPYLRGGDGDGPTSAGYISDPRRGKQESCSTTSLTSMIPRNLQSQSPFAVGFLAGIGVLIVLMYLAPNLPPSITQYIPFHIHGKDWRRNAPSRQPTADSLKSRPYDAFWTSCGSSFADWWTYTMSLLFND